MKCMYFFASLCLFAGCKKDQGTGPDTQKPVIAITSPANNQVFTAGQTVTIQAMITDDTKIEEVHLEILNTTTNVLYTHEHYTPGAASYILTQTFSIPAATTYRIKIEADDATGNQGEAVVNVSAN